MKKRSSITTGTENINRSRVLKIPGVRNLRDLGGYKTLDGRTVKWGRLFRSGRLSDLPSRGLDILSEIDFYAIIDFRSTYEVQRQPDRVPDGPAFIHLPVMDEANREMSREIRRRIQDSHFDGFDPSSLILKAYQQFPTEFTPAYKTFMENVRDSGGAPVLWHCTAGKDRTGYAAAILLRLFGVDQSTIDEDYLLSNQHVKLINKRVLAAIMAGGFKAYRMIKPLLGVQIQWLKASFETIDKEWGSFEIYTREGLGLTDSDINRIKDIYLE